MKVKKRPRNYDFFFFLAMPDTFYFHEEIKHRKQLLFCVLFSTLPKHYRLRFSTTLFFNDTLQANSTT